MRTIHYGQHPFVTTDSIANEMLEYAEALASRRQSAVVEIPIVLSGTAAMASILIGHGIPLASIPRSSDEEPPASQTLDSRDEFGSPHTDIDAAASVIGELVAHRATHALIEAAAAVRAGGSQKRSDAAVDERAGAGARADRGDTGLEEHRGTVTSIAEGTPPRRARAERAEQAERSEQPERAEQGDDRP